MDAVAVSRIEATAKALGLSAEAAGTLVQHDHDLVTAYAADAQKAWTEQVKTWETELTTDTEVGGAAFKANIEFATRALEKYGTKEFREELQRSGYGNHPGLVRCFVKIGKAMAEDALHVGAPGQGVPIEKTFFDHPTSQGLK